MDASDLKFRLSILDATPEEPERKKVIEEVECSWAELPETILEKTYSPISYALPFRNKDNYSACSLVVLDYDKNLSLVDCETKLKEMGLAYVLATTKSHQKPKGKEPPCDRFRVIVPTSRPLTSEFYKDTLRYLEEKLDAFADQKCFDLARYFFKSVAIVGKSGKAGGRALDPVRSWGKLRGRYSTYDIVGFVKEHGTYRGIGPKKEGKTQLHYVKCPWANEHSTEGTTDTFVCEADPGKDSKPIFECHHSHCKGRELRAFLALYSPADTDAFCAELRSDENKPTLVVSGGDADILASRIEKILIQNEVDIYVRGSDLVIPVVEELAACDGKKTIATRLKPVTQATLFDYFSAAATWKRKDGRSKNPRVIDPPESVIKVFASRDGNWNLRKLTGLIATPTLRGDLTLLSKPGFDSQTGWLLVEGLKIPEIPKKPTEEDARRALDLFLDLLSEFPFVDDASRSVGLSALLTPILRGAIPVAPLHAMRAPTAGSGKSYLIDIVAAIATGDRCPVISAGKNEEEMEKRLGAAVMSGQQLISLDNLNGEVYGDALCQLVERPKVQLRILGRSELYRGDSRATIFATGNNIRPGGDLVRRTLLCQMDANSDRPETRSFRKNPMEMVLNDRGKYVAGALTIVLAYAAKGCPGQLTMGSFGEWSRLVRSSLLWLGQADPVKTIEASRMEDPESEQLRQVVAAWKDAVGFNHPTTAKELIRKAGGEIEESALYLALRSVATGYKGLDSVKFGRWLSSHVDKIALGAKIVRTYDRHLELNKWSLQPLAPMPVVAPILAAASPELSLEEYDNFSSSGCGMGATTGMGANPFSEDIDVFS